MNQHFTTDDALYGLRNLSVLDDEQTRIADYDVLPDDVRALVDAGDYEGAYTLMIVPALAHLTRDEVADAARAWAESFVADCTDEPEPDEARDLAADMMNVYDELHAR
jgi:hypothetical protein